jgi:hypothetical protein
MKRTLVVAAAVAALALAVCPAAVAKEIKAAQVCGADGCTAVDDGTDREALVNGGPPRTPPTAAPFYKLRIEIDTGGGHTERFHVAAVPDRLAARGEDGTWMGMPAEQAAVLARLTRSHRAFPAADLVGAAPAPAPAPKHDAGSPLWPEGVLIALALAGGGVILVRAAQARGRFRAASS